VVNMVRDFFEEFFEKYMRQFERLREEMEKQFARQFKQLNLIVPQVDITKENGELVIKADLPGMRKEDIEIAASPDQIEISAERQVEKEKRGKKFYRRERAQAAFYRALSLPVRIDPKSVKAEYKDGVLTIRAKTKEEKKKVKVKVK